MSPRVRYWAQCCLTYSPITWIKGQMAPQQVLVTPSWDEWPIPQKLYSPSEELWQAGEMLRRTAWNSAKASAGSYTWGGTTPWNKKQPVLFLFSHCGTMPQRLRMPLWVQCSGRKINFIFSSSFSDIFLLAKPYVSQVTNNVKSFLVVRRNIVNGEGG